jgi:pectate lyase
LLGLVLLWAGIAQAASPCPDNQPPAFPTAEGFGRCAKGGRGGQVIEVTNLNDAGPGSLRACLEASGPRTCVFRTGGTIPLASNLKVINPFLTVAGQTAPGDGIQLKNYGIQTIRDGAHDIIIRYLRIRPGTANPAGISGANIGGLTLYGNNGRRVYNIIADHVDTEWAVDQNASAWDWVTDATFQWCLIAEGSLTGHPKGSHSMGVLVGGDDRITISIHHSLFAHNGDRNPLVKDGAFLDFRNNVVYNWGGNNAAKCAYNAKLNLVNNHFITGLDTAPDDYVLWVHDGGKVYLDGNWGPRCPSGCANGWDIGVLGHEATDRVPAPFFAPALTTHPPSEVKALVLANAGATLPSRDVVDARIIQDVLNGTGRVGIGSGYPVLAAGTPPVDTDHDGMPDAWEQAHGLDPASAADGPQVSPNGYTHLENYLNELAGDPVPPWAGVPGDLTGDDQVTVADVRRLIEMLLGTRAPDLSRADLTGDGKVSLADARELVHLLVTP